MTKFTLASLIGFALLIPTLVSAQVLINEIAWMGTTVSANDEWIELKNTSDQSINLGGWQLQATDGSPAISLAGEIQANGYYLLERTDDDSVPGIPADLIYSGSIGNSGENFQLLDAVGNLMDEAPFANDWPGGDNATKQTLEKSSLETWATSLEPNGTPKAQNSTAEEEPEEPECPECPTCPDCPDCPEVPECQECLECPDCPEIPECPECPPVLECPELPDLNTAINVSADEISDVADGQKIIIQGKIKRRPIFFFGRLVVIGNLKTLILGNKFPRLRRNYKVEATGRLLQTPAGPILIVYHTNDIAVTR